MNQYTTVKRILLVDDDPVYRMTMEYLFKHAYPEIEIQLVGDPEEVLSLIQSFKPELMILDVNLPVCTGWELLDEARSFFDHSPRLKPFIAMSSSSIDLDDSKMAKTRSDVDAYAEKPLTPEKIDRLITAYQKKKEI